LLTLCGYSSDLELMICLESALIRQNACFSIDEPSKKALEVLEKWWKKKRPLIDTHDGKIMEKEDGVVCMKSKDEPDRLSRVIRDNMGFFLGWFHEVTKLKLLFLIIISLT
jgi:hypothetical protein